MPRRAPLLALLFVACRPMPAGPTQPGRSTFASEPESCARFDVPGQSNPPELPYTPKIEIVEVTPSPDGVATGQTTIRMKVAYDVGEAFAPGAFRLVPRFALTDVNSYAWPPRKGATAVLERPSGTVTLVLPMEKFIEVGNLERPLRISLELLFTDASKMGRPVAETPLFVYEHRAGDAAPPTIKLVELCPPPGTIEPRTVIYAKVAYQIDKFVPGEYSVVAQYMEPHPTVPAVQMLSILTYSDVTLDAPSGILDLPLRDPGRRLGPTRVRFLLERRGHSGLPAAATSFVTYTTRAP